MEGLTDLLYLHDNQLTNLPQTLQRLVTLRYLNLSENAFETFPDAVSHMKSLIEQRMTDNGLKSVPESIERLSRLRELHLCNNQLTTLPASIDRLSELRQIDLRGNPFDTIAHQPNGAAATGKVGSRGPRASGVARRSRDSWLRNVPLSSDSLHKSRLSDTLRVPSLNKGLRFPKGTDRKDSQ